MYLFYCPYVVLQMASEALHLFSSSKSSKPSLPLMQFTVRHLAEEMTLLDGEMIRRIRVEELAGCCWIKKKKVCYFIAG